MSISADINSIVKIKKIKQGLPALGNRAEIPSSTSDSSPVLEEQSSGIESPLTREILTTEVVRVYQNNDNASPNWIDEERALTYKDTDANGTVITTDTIIWPA